MVENFLDMEPGDPNRGHEARSRSAQVVRGKGREAEVIPLVPNPLREGPDRHRHRSFLPPAAGREKVLRLPEMSPRVLEQRQGKIGQRHLMRLAVLRALLRNRPHPVLEVELLPGGERHFPGPLRGHEDQLQGCADLE